MAQSSLQSNWNASPAANTSGTNVPRPLVCASRCRSAFHALTNAATRFPDVQFIFSHAGGTLVSIAQRILGNEVSAEGLAKPPEKDSRLYHVRRFHYDTAGSANRVQLQALKLLVPAS